MKQLPRITEGAWVNPIRHGFRLQCCKCGLTHRFNFRLVKRGKGRMIEFQVFPDKR